MIGTHKLDAKFWWVMRIDSNIRKTRIETRNILSKLRARGMTQKQCAALMGGPAAYHRFREIARGKHLPDSWEMGRLREMVAEN